MKPAAMQGWAWAHKWSSLVCTAFLLILCITGLPLLFADELTTWVEGAPPPAVTSASVARADLDPMVAQARILRPHEVVTGIFLDPDAPIVAVHMATSMAAANANFGVVHTIKFDAATGKLLVNPAHGSVSANRVNQVIFALHTRLLMGGFGLALMGVMGALFVIALVSGVVLYAPFMRRIPFGTIRFDRSVRLRQLDWHNLLSAVVLAWALVVGVTGVFNELNDPLFDYWSSNVVAAQAAHWKDGAPRNDGRLASVQAALQTARHALPGYTFTGIDYPGAALNSNQHYMFWSQGNTPATARLMTPVMIDAHDGRLTAVLPMPWYLRAIELSRPFHFGDYGGLPLKILWLLFDLATIGVLVTGLWLRPAHKPS